ncbi:MAG: T9SS type A sorting domain-containing protein [candidate division Zixibacteria bacterium]|nr:T9SS type A sorting domain-containing protein [candidate division Zixibacteria bacterium]MBU1470801.1 T9SS type A sorting domain-containing protein [candidate division Zixibacteria bacterium]MBU2625324.1 T9SS type A sorting domain-containing protein [candidate division Zixibacteria bacterium]
MKQKNLSVLTLLASLMLLIFSGSAFAATGVTFVNKTLIHDCVDTLTVNVTADDAISCFDMVAEIATATGGAFGTLTEVILNYGDDSDISMVNGSPDDVFRFYGCNLGGGDVIPAGTDVLAKLVVTVSTDLGTFTIDESSIVGGSCGVYGAVPGFVSGCSFTALTVNAGTYTVINNDPYFTNCPTLISTTCAAGTISYNFDATDDDCGTTLTYSLGTGTGGGINVNTGMYQINVSQMCGNYSFQIIVTDEHGATAACNFDLFVDDVAPHFTACPTDGSITSLLWGYLASGSVDAEDPDLCPATLEYTMCGISGPGVFPGTFNLDSGNGDWSWQTEELPEYVGTWEICIEVSDGCKSAQCTFEITVLPTYRVLIEKVHDQYQGHYTEVEVSLTDITDFIGGFDFLISYDASALTFMEATIGVALVNDCDWEYFTYRAGQCSGPCPSGLVRIVGMAEMNNGPHHPSCFSQGPIVLATLKFYVTNDRTFDCMFVPVGFYWLDCGDNTISGVSGDTLWVSRYVYGYDDPPYLLDPAENQFVAGWQSIIPAIDCDADPDGDGPKLGPLVGIDFWGGGVDIACADSIDARGDLNLNEVANEIADAVLYTNYFIYGLGVFNPLTIEGQIAASDVNADGRILTVGDLVYLTRVITGDALPYPKLTPYATSVDVIVERVGSDLTVGTSSSVDIGAAHFVFSVDGNVTVTSLVNGMNILSDVVDGELRVLVYDIGSGRINAGANELISITSDGNVELVETNFSDYYGNLMTTNTSAKVLPSNFALNQNFPNPFNPSTEISIDVPGQSDWKLDIYNVTGQLIESFSGYTAGGRVIVTWDAGTAASGIYFYKATVGQYTDVKKMVLMK